MVVTQGLGKNLVFFLTTPSILDKEKKMNDFFIHWWKLLIGFESFQSKLLSSLSKINVPVYGKWGTEEVVKDPKVQTS